MTTNVTFNPALAVVMLLAALFATWTFAAVAQTGKTSAMKAIDSDFSVAAQIRPEDLPAIAAAGVKTIVNNRPDNEERGQPLGAAIEAAAKAHGLDYVHLPVVSGKLDNGDADAFAKVLDAARAKGPVLAYCRSGSRTTALWALSQAGKRPLDEIMRKASLAGYDLAPLKPRLQSRFTQQQ